MATQNVNIGINVSDNGTAKKVVKSFEEITTAATKAQRAAQGISAQPVKSTIAPGGTSGSRRASEPAGVQGVLSGQEYGRGRGAMGATGASARDFANQAQGLGGLVRLYATYAANLFAVGAAFTALKSAADTTNLVKGLNTLGAASGQNLGTLSKRLVEVTDGAVSMREAMTATAQASSAGMSGKNIERLALVAKNASLALGVSMPDALSRISRGIVKLEPELLDELGLFTKIGPATEKYALEIGKSAGALTDFERRQAFANAVLEEGEKKFGALAEAAANPYDKLLSSLKNILQSGGELINKVLTPLVGLLANSPTALAAVLTGIGVVLLKQAIPAIGQLRAGLRNTAEDALKASVAFKESFGDEFQTILEKRFKIPDLEAGVKKAETDLAKMKFPGKMPGSIERLVGGELSQTNVNKALATRNTLIETGMRGTKKASEAQIAAAKEEILYIQKAIDLYAKKQAVSAARTGTEEVAGKPLGMFDPEVIALQKYEKLRNKVAMADAIANAAQVAGVAGVRASWGLLNQEIAEKGITGFNKYSTLAQGGLAAIGTRVMGVVSSLGTIGQVIGLAIAGFMLLDSWFTKNSKQAEKFSNALTTSQESIANVSRTISAATSTEGFATATIANTVAFSNALNEVSGSLSEVIKLSREADKAANSWDKFWDNIFSFIGKDRASKLAKTVAEQIQSSIDLLSREGLADKYKSEIQKILQVDDIENVDKVADAFKNLNKEQQNALISIQENSNRALGNVSSALQGFKDKTDEALKAQKVLSNTFLDTSPTTKYGESLVAVSNSLNELLAQGPAQVAKALEEVSKNMEKAAMFGPEFVNQFGKISSEFGKQKAVIDSLSSALVTYQKQLKLANTAAGTKGAAFTETEGAPSAMRQTSTVDIVAQQGPRQEASIASSYVRELQRALVNAPRDTIDKSIKLVEAASKSLFDKGMAFIGKAVREAQTTTAITIGKVLTSNLTGPQKLQAETAFTQQEIKARLADIQVSEQMLDTQNALVNEMRLANALQAESNILQKNAGKLDQAALKQNEDASKEVFKARYGLGVDTTELSAKQKEELDLAKTRQKQTQQAALRPAKILAEGQLTASQLALKGGLPGAELAQAEELKKINDKTNASLAARQDILSGIASVTSAEIIKSKQDVELKTKSDLQVREIAIIQEKINEAESKRADALKLGGEAGKTALETQTKQLDFLEKVKTETEKTQKADNSVEIAKNRKELLTEELIAIDKRYETLRSTNDLENQIATTRLESQSQLVALQANANQYSQEYILKSQSALDREKALVDTTIAREQAEAALAQKRETSEARIAVLKLDNSEKSKLLIAAETAELDRQTNLTNNIISGLINQYTNKVAILDKTKQINLEQEKYNVLLDTSSKLAESLSTAFGDIGAKLGGVSSALINIAVSSEKSAKAMADLVFDRDAANDPKERARIEEEIGKQTAKNARTELANNTKLAGAAKTLFKEKTVAYKAFAAVEKGLQIASLALEIKTTLTKLGLWASEVPAKAATEAGVTGAAVAGAAARAPITFGEIVGNYIAKIPAPFGMIAGVAAGAYFLSLLGLGNRGGAAPAGFTAEQQQKVQGTGQAYDTSGKIVTRAGGALGDPTALAKSVETSIDTLSKNFFGIFDTDNSKLINTLKSIQDNTKETAIALVQGATGLFGGRNPFGFEEGTSKGTLGFSKSSKSIADEGIKIRGTLDGLANGIGDFDQYINTVVSSSSWWGLSKSSVSNTEIAELEKTAPRAVLAIRKTIAGVRDSLIQSADFFYGTNSFAKNIVKETEIELKASAKDLSATEFADLLMSEITIELNAAAEKAMPELRGFKQLGEEYYQTLSRIRKDTQTVVDGFAMIGVPSKEITGSVEKVSKSFFGLVNRIDTVNMSSLDADLVDKTKLEQQLIEAAGGADAFAEGLNTVFNSFLTNTERYDQTFGKLSTVFQKAGVVLPKTALEYSNLIKTTTDVKQLGTLIKYTNDYNTLLGLESTLLDERQAAEDKRLAIIKEQTDAAQQSANKLKQFTDNLKSFRDNLVLGSQSILTPLQKYGEAKLQFEQTYTQAMAGDENAQSRLTTSAQSFLTASKDYFASSSQYTQDFNTVLDKIGFKPIQMEDQLDISKKQRDLLSSIDTNIALLVGVPQAAKGGPVKGLTIVGERGPELVDFTYPGMVYPADQTRGMFAPQATMSGNMNQVVQELRQVKQELSQLRKDQQQQTGDIIISNYDANQKASEEIATAVVNTSQDAAWTDRSKSEIK